MSDKVGFTIVVVLHGFSIDRTKLKLAGAMKGQLRNLALKIIP